MSHTLVIIDSISEGQLFYLKLLKLVWGLLTVTHCLLSLYKLLEVEAL